MILDKNDCPPEFQNVPAAYLASEDLAPGQVIASITAVDPDTIGAITYSIQTKEQIPFALDPRSGLLLLEDPLDRETVAEYQLVVRADDGVQFTDVNVVVQVSLLLLLLLSDIGLTLSKILAFFLHLQYLSSVCIV